MVQDMPDQDKPRVRIVKKGQVPKLGVLQIERPDGRTQYRCECDVCGEVEQVHFLPKADRDFHCKICLKITQKGKPSTFYKRKRGTVVYVTQCDLCGQTQDTPFLPQNNRMFHCNSCHRKQPQRAMGPLKPGVEVLGTKEEPLYLVPCDHCRKKVQLKFAPTVKERFSCQDCHGKMLDEKRRGRQERKDKPDTRLLFILDCVDCGKRETVNFVPTKRDQAICTSCFKKRTRRGNHGKNHSDR